MDAVKYILRRIVSGVLSPLGAMLLLLCVLIGPYLLCMGLHDPRWLWLYVIPLPVALFIAGDE